MSARAPVAAAGLSAGLIIAQQMGAKATRDALFFSSFNITHLPQMMIGASIASILFAFFISPTLNRFGPRRAARWGFAVSAVLLMGEWGLVSVRPGLGAIALYLHTAVFGAVLISWFWSVVNETFDPRTAKKKMSKIAASATLGGLLGGILAERVGALVGVTAMMPVLSALHLLAAWAVSTVSPILRGQAEAEETATGDPRFGLRVLQEVSYLRLLALLVILVTVAAAMLDYVFKAQVTRSMGEGQDLIRFFAVFYTVVSLLSFIVQAGVSRVILQRTSLSGAVALLPITIIGGSVGVLAFPGMVSAVLARGMETVLRSSLFRSAYELLFTPIEKYKKRATKTLIDVGVDRLGDAAGGGTIQLLLLSAGAAWQSWILFVCAAIGLVGVGVARRLQSGYVKSLEESLLNRAMELDLEEVGDKTTRQTLLKTMTTFKVNPSKIETRVAATQDHIVDVSLPEDPVLRTMGELRSKDPQRVRKELNKVSGLSPTVVPHVVKLLAWDAVSEEAVRALGLFGMSHMGQLTDALLDEEKDFAIRRRVPRVLAEIESSKSAWALFRGLADKRFEVRFQCGRALARLQKKKVDMPYDRDDLLAVVERELAVDKRVWESRRLLERLNDDRDSIFVDSVLRERASRSLEHVFTLLALTLPRAPLKVAFRGLHTQDQMLRGTALEYLESILPERIKASLWPFLEGDAAGSLSGRTRDEILAELLRSQESIQISLQELAKHKP